VLGSGELVHDLAADGRVDEYLLVIAPLLLGPGRRLFRPGAEARLTLVESQATSTGALITRYRPAG
jgi:dihydrofolate reductase